MPTARPRFRLRTRGKGRLRARRECRRADRGNRPCRLLRERRGRGIGGARLDRPGRLRLAHRTLGVDAGTNRRLSCRRGKSAGLRSGHASTSDPRGSSLSTVEALAGRDRGDTPPAEDAWFNQ